MGGYRRNAWVVIAEIRTLLHHPVRQIGAHLPLLRGGVLLKVVGHGDVQQGIVLCLLPPAAAGTEVGEGDDLAAEEDFHAVVELADSAISVRVTWLSLAIILIINDSKESAFSAPRATSRATLSPTKAQITEFFRPLVNSQINFRDFIENNYLEVDSNVEKLTRKYYDCTPQQLIEKYKTS